MKKMELIAALAASLLFVSREIAARPHRGTQGSSLIHGVGDNVRFR